MLAQGAFGAVKTVVPCTCVFLSKDAQNVQKHENMISDKFGVPEKIPFRLKINSPGARGGPVLVSEAPKTSSEKVTF